MNITIAPMENKFYVYAHQRLTDGKCFYIGKGTRSRAWETTNRNKYWRNVVAKHGFRVEILINNISEEKAFELEKEFIRQIGKENLVNMTDGGEGVSGLVFSEEARQKISKAKKGKQLSEEHRAKISAATKGENNPNFGKKHSEKTRQKISDAKPKKPVFQYTKNGQFIAKFNSIREASRVTEISQANISECSQGKRKSAGGYIWQFIEN